MNVERYETELNCPYDEKINVLIKNDDINEMLEQGEVNASVGDDIHRLSLTAILDIRVPGERFGAFNNTSSEANQPLPTDELLHENFMTENIYDDALDALAELVYAFDDFKSKIDRGDEAESALKEAENAYNVAEAIETYHYYASVKRNYYK